VLGIAKGSYLELGRSRTREENFDSSTTWVVGGYDSTLLEQLENYRSYRVVPPSVTTPLKIPHVLLLLIIMVVCVPSYCIAQCFVQERYYRVSIVQPLHVADDGNMYSSTARLVCPPPTLLIAIVLQNPHSLSQIALMRLGGIMAGCRAPEVAFEMALMQQRVISK
jgi:hypothetical protein